MANTNRMTNLLNKIERRIGVKQLHLPDELSKDTWVDVIIDESLTEYSRKFPLIADYLVNLVDDPTRNMMIQKDKVNEVQEITSRLNQDKTLNNVTKNKNLSIDIIETTGSTINSTSNNVYLANKDGWYMIDESQINGFFLGIQDIDYSSLAVDNRFYIQQMGIGQVDYMSMQSGIGMEDFAMAQMGANMSGLFNNGIFLETQGDNMFRISNCLGYKMRWLKKCRLKIRLRHSESLNTISAGTMTIFEDLCCADVATYLYNELKFYDGQDTGYGNYDLHMDKLEEWMNKRGDIIEQLTEASVSASNPACPIMWTI